LKVELFRSGMIIFFSIRLMALRGQLEFRVFR
jgi:hypothetical protein